MDGLRAYRAGAGTGKTYQVCEEIVEALTDPNDPVDPSAVLATTFTRSAAAELKSRIQQRILTEEDLSPLERSRLAEQVEFAAVGTVHSVAWDLLQKYALTIGLSPRLQVLDEDAAERHLEEVIAEMPPEPWQDLLERGRRLERSEPRKLARTLLREKRTNDIDDDAFREQMRASADRLCEILAPGGPERDAPEPDRLASLADEAISSIKKLDDDYKTTAGALENLRRLRRIESPTWQDVASAGKLSASKTTGANECLDDLRTFAAQVRLMPGLHDDVRAYTNAMAEQVLAVQNAYSRYKHERGLLDFTDLEVLFLEALAEDEVRQDLAATFDLVLVDEFQDSNPIQLEIFLRLHEIVGQSCWVGDSKQSIFAFRDADLELAEAAWRLVEEDYLEDLPVSHRAHQGLVDVQNEIFEPVFGEEARLSSHWEGEDEAIERWFLEASNNAGERQALARGIGRLVHEDGWNVGDIAVLTRTNYEAAERANALEREGIPAVVARPGLLATRECRLTLAGLALVVDPYDTLAAAEVLHLLRPPEEETPSWLEDRLRAVAEASDSHVAGPPWPDQEPLAAVRGLDARNLSPSDAAGAVVQALGILARLAQWGKPERRAANLDALVDLAHQYEGQMQEEGRGASVAGLLTWLEEKHEEGEDTHPLPHSIEAVTVSTYHGAKGLEWPAVVLTGLGKTYPPDLWEPRTYGGRAEDGNPLADRELHCWIWPFGTTWNPYRGEQPFTGTGLLDDGLQSPEGQEEKERTRKEEKRLLYVGMTRASEKLVLTHRGNPEAGPSNTDWLDQVPHRTVLDIEASEGEHELEGIRTTLRVRHLEPKDADRQSGEEIIWAIQEPPVDTEAHQPRVRRPHEREGPDEVVETDVRRLPGDNPFPKGWSPEDWTVFGQAAHAYLAGLLSLADRPREEKVNLAEICLERPDGSLLCEPGWLVDAGECLESWVEEAFPESAWYTEVPVVGAREEGGSWVGNVDLLLVDENDHAVIVDHKFTDAGPESAADRALDYSGQLLAYADSVRAQGMRVRSAWIHFPMARTVVRMDPGNLTRC